MKVLQDCSVIHLLSSDILTVKEKYLRLIDSYIFESVSLSSLSPMHSVKYL